MAASYYGHLELATVLIKEHGATVDLKDDVSVIFMYLE